MDIKSPSSEPSKSYEKSNAEKSNTEKAEKQEVALKPNDKPKPKNKIERPKIDSQKEPKNKIQREKIDLDAPTKNKIERPKIDLNKETRNKIQREKIDLSTPAKNKIERPKIDLQKEPKNKIQREKIDLSTPAKNKIERIPTTEPKNSAKLEVNQLSLEQIKDELTKFNWKTISENWTIKLSANKEITLNPYELPSKENPLYKHKKWLQTVYYNPSWDLNGVKIGKICDADQGTISRWRKRLQIPIKPDLALKKLYFDGKSKECGRCHKIKPYNNFTFRRKNEILYPKSTCKKCDGEQKQVFALKNKIKVMENLYNGKFGLKCPECNTGPEKLPALEFHHTVPYIKETSWHARMYKNWEQTKKLLENEKVKVLCRNCHNKQRAKTYKNYGNLIKSTNFNLNASTKEIRDYIKNNSPKPIKVRDISEIEHQIKKFTLVNKLYGGKCVGCEQITTRNNLPSINFHHRDFNEDKGKLWSKVRNYELNQIKNELITKNCVGLCGNCHQMIRSNNFRTQHEEIISSEHWGKVKTYFNILEKKINNFKFQKESDQRLMLKSKISLNKERIGIGHAKEENINVINITQQKDVGEYLKIIRSKNPIHLKVDVDGELRLKPKLIQKEINRNVKDAEKVKSISKNVNYQKNFGENIKYEKEVNHLEINRNIIKLLNNKELNRLQKVKYEYGEAWMKYLFHIAKLSQEKTIIRTKDIAESVGVITRNVRKNLVKLVNKELITISSELNDRHVLLSDLGLEELLEINKLKQL